MGIALERLVALNAERAAEEALRGNAGQIEDILDALCSLGLARNSRGKYSR